MTFIVPRRLVARPVTHFWVSFQSQISCYLHPPFFKHFLWKHLQSSPTFLLKWKTTIIVNTSWDLKSPTLSPFNSEFPISSPNIATDTRKVFLPLFWEKSRWVNFHNWFRRRLYSSCNRQQVFSVNLHFNRFRTIDNRVQDGFPRMIVSWTECRSGLKMLCEFITNE